MRTYVISSRLILIALFTCMLLLAACGQASSPGSSNTQSPAATATTPLDVYGTPIVFPKTAPQKIVSMTASTSEVLAALQLQSRVVGVDYYTNYPADIAALPKVSDMKGYNVEKIVSLKPDLVLSTGGLTKDTDTQLTKLGLHVVDLPPVNLEQSLQQIILVGRLTFTESTATALVKQLDQQIAQIKSKVAGTTAPKVLLEVDASTPGKPFVFGGGSFGDEMLLDANGVNIFHTNSSGQGYPQVTDESVIAANPQYVILTEDPLYGGNPSDAYKRANWSTLDALKMHKVYHINSDIMQRPGPRLVQGLQCLAQTIHPDKFSGDLPAYCSASI